MILHRTCFVKRVKGAKGHNFLPISAKSLGKRHKEKQESAKKRALKGSFLFGLVCELECYVASFGVNEHSIDF